MTVAYDGAPRVRNHGYLGTQSRKKLAAARVAVAGTGAIGGEIAYQLACLGIGSFVLADPDKFDVSNLNRQRGAQIGTLGRFKVEVLAELIAQHDPSTSVRCFTQGVTQDNLDEFLAGVDLVVEATDFTQPKIGAMVAREAARRGIPVIVGAEVGWGVTATLFEPNGYSYDKFYGLDRENGEMDLSSLIGHVPFYADIKVLAAVQEGKISAPATAPAVATSGATLASQAVKRLTGVGSPVTAPRLLHIDPYGPTKCIIRWRKLHYWASVVRCVIRCRLGLNEQMEI